LAFRDDDKAYYLINNVPVGTYSLKAQFIGYSPMQQDGARVLANFSVIRPGRSRGSRVGVRGGMSSSSG